MRVHLLELQQKGIVAFGTDDGAKARVRDRGGEFLLFRKGKEAVALDADDECRLGDSGEGDGGCLWGFGGHATPGDVMGVEFSGHCDVTVAVEATDEFFTLVAEIGLRGKMGGGAFALR